MLNVIDKYRAWEIDLIRQDVQSHTFPFAVAMQHWEQDFNLASLIRSANAFGAKEVFYLSDHKKYDRRGTVGTHHYTQVNHLKSIEELLSLKEKYRFIGIDNIPGSVGMRNFVWPENTLMIFGSETQGLQPEVIELCESIVFIEQFGSVRSINCACAASIAMVNYIDKQKNLL